MSASVNGLAIRRESLSRDFGRVRDLSDLSIEVPRHNIRILGPNGSGKTTTINLLPGLWKPTRGHAEVLGYDTRNSADAVRERTGALLEHTGLYEQMSAEDNLEFYARAWRMPSHERRARINDILCASAYGSADPTASSSGVGGRNRSSPLHEHSSTTLRWCS